MSKSVLLSAEGLERTYVQGDNKLTIFRNLNITLEAGEIVALVGSSGAGKSTLLQLIGLLDSPTRGKIILGGKDVSNVGDEQRTLLRRHFLGFVYQFHYLQPEFSALENVMLPMMINHVSKSDAEQKSKELLESMKLGARLNHRPARLSGGEQQRVAIARALANSPQILLADEPTGNLDPSTADDVFDMLLNRARETGVSALIATHNMDLAQRMDRILELKNGQLKPY